MGGHALNTDISDAFTAVAPKSGLASFLLRPEFSQVWICATEHTASLFVWGKTNSIHGTRLDAFGYALHYSFWSVWYTSCLSAGRRLALMCFMFLKLDRDMNRRFKYRLTH